MVNYLQKFEPNLSKVTALKGTSSSVKGKLSAASALKFFHPKEDVQLQRDKFYRGLGACLMQGSQPVAYTSCSMTETEVNYAIEKEVVVILFGVEE